MKISARLGIVGIFLGVTALFASACVGQAPQSGDEAVEEAEQELVTCTTDCSGVSGGVGFQKSCSSSCVATNTQITCDGQVFSCINSSQCSPLEGEICDPNWHFKCSCGTWLYKTYDCYGNCVMQDQCCCTGGGGSSVC